MQLLYIFSLPEQLSPRQTSTSSEIPSLQKADLLTSEINNKAQRYQQPKTTNELQVFVSIPIYDKGVDLINIGGVGGLVWVEQVDWLACQHNRNVPLFFSAKKLK